MPAKVSAKEEIVARIDDALKNGIVPWVQPWIGGASVARNLKTKKPYRGLNVLLLAVSRNPGQWWVTYKQAEELGGNILKGEKGTRLFFWMQFCHLHKQSADKCQLQNRSCTSKDWSPFMKGFTVFNAETQTEGLESKIPARTALMKDDAGALDIGLRLTDRLETYWLSVHEGGSEAFYNPMGDDITLPPTKDFLSGRRYYQTGLHELVHSTGHADRLDRHSVGTKFGDPEYAREELVAEMGSCIAMIELGAEPVIDQSASYIAGWRKKIKDDPDLFNWAAGRAAKAVDLLFATEETE